MRSWAVPILLCLSATTNLNGHTDSDPPPPNTVRPLEAGAPKSPPPPVLLMVSYGRSCFTEEEVEEVIGRTTTGEPITKKIKRIVRDEATCTDKVPVLRDCGIKIKYLDD